MSSIRRIQIDEDTVDFLDRLSGVANRAIVELDEASYTAWVQGVCAGLVSAGVRVVLLDAIRDELLDIGASFFDGEKKIDATQSSLNSVAGSGD